MSIVEIRNLDLFYGSFHAIKGVNMNIEPNKITSMIGPSGCGKSTLLRCLNRMNDVVEESLKAVMLWDDLKDKLENNALNLSLEQRQRLCVARLIAVRPDIILLDEPCSALDPIATTRIEELMIELKKKYTIVIVTHNMQQAARVSDDTGFMLLGDLVEFGKTSQIFTAPKLKKTEDYITGRFG